MFVKENPDRKKKKITLKTLLFISFSLSTNAKLFIDNTFLFSVIHNSQISANVLNKDLEMIN